MSEAGFLEVGHNEQGQVIINLPHDMTGHIVFSPSEAAALGNTLKLRAEMLLAGCEPVSLEEVQRLRHWLCWAVDLLEMTNDYLISLGEPEGKVKCSVFLEAMGLAKGILRETESISITVPPAPFRLPEVKKNP